MTKLTSLEVPEQTPCCSRCNLDYQSDTPYTRDLPRSSERTGQVDPNSPARIPTSPFQLSSAAYEFAGLPFELSGPAYEPASPVYRRGSPWPTCTRPGFQPAGPGFKPASSAFSPTVASITKSFNHHECEGKPTAPGLDTNPCLKLDTSIPNATKVKEKPALSSLPTFQEWKVHEEWKIEKEYEMEKYRLEHDKHHEEWKIEKEYEMKKCRRAEQTKIELEALRLKAVQPELQRSFCDHEVQVNRDDIAHQIQLSNLSLDDRNQSQGEVLILQNKAEAENPSYQDRSQLLDESDGDELAAAYRESATGLKLGFERHEAAGVIKRQEGEIQKLKSELEGAVSALSATRNLAYFNRREAARKSSEECSKLEAELERAKERKESFALLRSLMQDKLSRAF